MKAGTVFQPKNARKAVLVLEDGSCFVGYGFGAVKRISGEVVFSTGMVGYPESLTDPSYYGQILVLTYPLIGNYGVPHYDPNLDISSCFESNGVKVSGLVVHELCMKPHHWACERTLDEWLEEEGVPGIWGIDTRRLTKKLRVEGSMLGILQVLDETEDPDLNGLLSDVKTVIDPNSRDLVAEVTVKEPVHYEAHGNRRVVLIDCGVKYSIIRNLLRRKVDVIRVPYSLSMEEIMEYNPDGVVISNGPGDPKKCVNTIQCVRELVKTDLPIMGICLGNQILALALGGDTYKLKYGHRSQNQPVLEVGTNKCYITTQNHGYAVSPSSLSNTDLSVWFINANDKTVEGLRHISKPIFAVQFHPEANPGPYDTGFLFDQFISLLEG